MREKIAKGMYERMNPASKFLPWGELDVGGNARKVWEAEAQAILALEVAGVPLSELIEKAESGKLCERVDISEFADMAENAKRVYAKPLALGESR